MDIVADVPLLGQEWPPRVQPDPHPDRAFREPVDRVSIAYEQARFAEGAAQATELLNAVGDQDDPPAARLLLGRAQCTHGLSNRLEDAVPDCERALEIARRYGDRELELDALDTLATARSEAGAMTGPEEWQAVEMVARELRRRRVVASALLNQAIYQRESEPHAALALIERSVEVSREHGLTEGLAWSECASAETLFGIGDWDAALAAAFRAVEIGDRNGYRRAVVRSWFVAAPIAASATTAPRSNGCSSGSAASGRSQLHRTAP